jgi:hypothetical protein
LSSLNELGEGAKWLGTQIIQKSKFQYYRLADGWCWFIVREKYYWVFAGGWFVLREKYCWLVANKPSKQDV